MPTIGGGDDFVWIGGPDEGLWLLVVVGDEAIDGGLEIDDAFEDAALEISRAQIDGDASTHPADSHDTKHESQQGRLRRHQSTRSP